MNFDDLRQNILDNSRLIFVRSSGPGGQNVNKVSSACTIHIPIFGLDMLSAEEQMNVYNALKNRINSKDELVFHCDETRSQHQNKELVLKRSCIFIERALCKPEIRVQTKIPKSSIERRLVQKNKRSQQKLLRSRHFSDNF